MQQKQWKWTFHLLFWLGHYLIRIFISEYHSPDFWDNAWIEFSEMPIKMLLAYLSIEVIQRFIKQWHLYLFCFALVGSFFLAWFLKRIHDWYIVFPIYADSSSFLKPLFWNFIQGTRQLIYVYPTVAGLVAINFTMEWFEKDRRSKALEKLQIENELKYLKSRIQPHFLFNTLNNLYGLSLQQSDKTPEMLLQLSDLLSFMLYQAEKKHIPIKKEVQLIHSLFHLEQLRSVKKVNFQFEYDSSLDEVLVPPLLLFPLAENAFKYGIGDEEGENFIQMRLGLVHGKLGFNTLNSIRTDIKADQNEKSGFGLQTLRQRLALLFPNEFEFEANADDSHFNARLTFPIKND